MNKQARAINEVIIYLFHQYNVMQILTPMMCILTDKIICGWSWRIWKLTLTRRAVQQSLLADWWINYDEEAPHLQKIAIKILSQTCSSSSCERN